MQRTNAGSSVSVSANSLVRIVAMAVGVSLVAAAGVLAIEAQTQPKPLHQAPAVLVTLALGALAVYAGSLAVLGRRGMAAAAWGVCVVLVVALPFIQLLPVKYETSFLIDLKALAPPLWPYALAIPLLLFLLLETSLPGVGANRTSNLFLGMGLTAAVMFLYFTTALIGDVANSSILIFIPRRLFLTVLTPVGLCALLVLGTVLPRRGLVLPGIVLLIVAGLGIEWMSTWSYDGPHFLESADRIPYPGYPQLPILAGTIPGLLAAAAGILAGWEVYVKRNPDRDPPAVLDTLETGE